MADNNLTLNSNRVINESNSITTIDIKQEISFFWVRGLILNVQRKGLDLIFKFFDIQTLKFMNSFIIKYSTFLKMKKDASSLKYTLDEKRGFFFVYNQHELKGYSVFKTERDFGSTEVHLEN